MDISLRFFSAAVLAAGDVSEIRPGIMLDAHARSHRKNIFLVCCAHHMENGKDSQIQGTFV